MTLFPLPSGPIAYRVPWTVDRSAERYVTLTNGGSEFISRVSTQFFGVGWMLPAVPRSALAPGASLRLVLFGEEALDTGRVAVHWARPDGDEFVWTFACG